MKYFASMSRRRLIQSGGALSALCICSSNAIATAQAGSFEGEFVAKFLDDGRLVLLLEPITFTDKNGSKWPVPKGITVDGASIPRALWAIVGGPFAGKYRRASVVHDHYCVTRDRDWRDVHRMFFEGCLADKVDLGQAKLMYAAVRRFGPRWTMTRNIFGQAEIIDQTIEFDQDEFDRLLQFVEENNPTPDQIDRRTS